MRYKAVAEPGTRRRSPCGGTASQGCEGGAGAGRGRGAGLRRASRLACYIGVAAAIFPAAGCTREQWHRFPSPDDLIAAIPWFAVMHRGIAIQPYKMPLGAPEGSVPITGTEPPLDVTPRNLSAIDRLVNPALRTAESLETGKRYYDIYCMPCHGPEGAGDGPVNAKLLIAPSVLTQRAQDLTDGYLYSMVRHGRGIMPAYGEGIRGENRWHVVNYVRQLQGAAQ